MNTTNTSVPHDQQPGNAQPERTHLTGEELAEVQHLREKQRTLDSAAVVQPFTPCTPERAEELLNQALTALVDAEEAGMERVRYPFPHELMPACALAMIEVDFVRCELAIVHKPTLIPKPIGFTYDHLLRAHNWAWELKYSLFPPKSMLLTERPTVSIDGADASPATTREED